MEQLRLAPSQMLPRSHLKKPLRDILRDVSKRSMANVDMRGGPGGSIIFEGKGSADAVRQALREVAQQVGSKVCPLSTSQGSVSNRLGCSNRSASQFRHPPGPTSLEGKAPSFRIFNSELVHGFRSPVLMIVTVARMTKRTIPSMCLSKAMRSRPRCRPGGPASPCSG